jgi:IS5 family transposase
MMSVPTNILLPEATMLIIAYPRDEGFFARAPFEYQLDPKMTKIDELLDNERVLLRVSLDLAHSAPHALETGRSATPVEVTVRLAVLRRLRGWSYRQVEEEVKGSVQWRGFCHIYNHCVPDHSTIQARETLIAAQTLPALNDLVVQQAAATGVTRGKKLRADSSLVETHIHYPTDSSLLADGVRVVGRTVARARAVVDGRIVRWKKTAFCNHARKAKRLARAIATLARRQSQTKARPSAERERQMRRAYRKLVGVAQASLDHAQRVLALLTPQRGNRKAVALRTTLAQVMPLVQRVIEQTRRRVLKGQGVPAADKVVSVFEPHTAIIQRGKVPPRDTEFGRKVWSSEVDGGLVSEYRLLPGNPPDTQDQWATSLQHHRALFGHPPTTATADRGVHSRDNEARAHSERIPEVALPHPGAKTPERMAYEAQPWFKAALRFRAGIEGRLSVLRGPRGLRRCLNRGEAGMERWVGWGVITNNLVVMATALTRRRRSRRETTT